MLLLKGAPEMRRHWLQWQADAETTPYFRSTESVTAPQKHFDRKKPSSACESATDILLELGASASVSVSVDVLETSCSENRTLLPGHVGASAAAVTTFGVRNSAAVGSGTGSMASPRMLLSASGTEADRAIGTAVMTVVSGAAMATAVGALSGVLPKAMATSRAADLSGGRFHFGPPPCARPAGAPHEHHAQGAA
jgi:hypothetical protein